MLNEYDVVRLKRDMPSVNLTAGAIGTILMIYPRLSGPPAYEVEFTDGGITTLALLTVTEDEIEKVLPPETKHGNK